MDVITARGHSNITARHGTTIEITRDREMSRRADCIIGVKADKGSSQLSEEFKRAARNSNARIMVTLEANGFREVILGRGHEALTFEDADDLVIRKSDFICPRTLMVRADKASNDLDRRLVDSLAREDTLLVATISVL